MSEDCQSERPVPRLLPTRPDTEIAGELRVSIREALSPVLDIMNEATRSGFVVSWTIGRDQIGRSVVMDVTIAKHF